MTNSPQNLKILIAEHTNPWINLATEDYIFRDMNPQDQILFLWRNSPTVVIGRFQNPWAECNLETMEKDGVILTRRQSGGGAVFHDLGNSCFTFMSGRESYKKVNNNQIITSALGKLGIKAYASGRNDILVEERKISGAAFKENKDRCFHHGTLLISANLEKLNHYLNPKKRKLETKGIASVRSRVANLTEFNPTLTHDIISDVLIKEFTSFYKGRAEIMKLRESDIDKNEHIFPYYQKMSSWEWRFGETPKFNHHVEFGSEVGNFDFHFFVEKGLVLSVEIFTDSLNIDLVPELKRLLVNISYDSLKFGYNLSLRTGSPEIDYLFQRLKEEI